LLQSAVMGKTIYIGGQNAINSEGQLVGGDNFELQTKQALENIKIALASENATFNDVIKLNITWWTGVTRL